MTRTAVLVLLGACASTPAARETRWADPGAALTTADSFAIRVNGQAVGTQVLSLQPGAAGGYRFAETTTLPQGSQTTEVLLSAGFAMQRVTQRGVLGGREMRIDVEYRAGHAAGRALTPAAAEPLTVDAAVPGDVVDDNVLAALLPALAWARDTEHVLSVFHSGKNQLEVRRVVVTGVEPIEIPAGRFESYRVEASGGDTPIVFYIDTARPHRVLRIELPGTPMDVVRIAGASAARAQTQRPTGSGDAAPLEWLAGCWEGSVGTRVIEEHWLAPRGGVLLGLSRTTRDGSVVEHEFMHIYPRDGALVLAATPSGQAPTEFAGRAPGNAEVLFENAAHDFPQRIRYRRVGQDSLVAEIEGGAGDALRRMRFPYVRVPCFPDLQTP